MVTYSYEYSYKYFSDRFTRPKHKTTFYAKCRSCNVYFWNVLSAIAIPADANRLPACVNMSNRDAFF